MKEAPFRPGVLMVDDEEGFLLAASITLDEAQIEPVWTMSDSRNVMEFLKENSNLVVVLDLTIPHLSGRELLSLITDNYPNVPVIILTAINDIKVAIDCLKHGARDYLIKPIEETRFVSVIKSALEIVTMREEVAVIKRSFLEELSSGDGAFSSIKTVSSKLESLFKYLGAVATSPHPILITGETGVGKELFAQAAHMASGRQGDLIPVNVAGLDDNIFSDTLFGHEKGAFTDASHQREGLIAKAQGGTLFLDEIGDLKPSSQIKLLRLLQEGQYYPLGSDTAKPSNARVVVATNHDLESSVNEGSFRKDLYYRLKTHEVHIPPLRERPEDIPLLLEHFIRSASENLGLSMPEYSPTLGTVLSYHEWPGNVRELESVVNDIVARTQGGRLSIEDFALVLGIEGELEEKTGERTVVETPPNPGTEGYEDTPTWMKSSGRLPTFDLIEGQLIIEAMRRTGGNRKDAAALLGIARQTLSNRLEKMGMADSKFWK